LAKSYPQYIVNAGTTSVLDVPSPTISQHHVG
jgi:hypothetical protein